MSERFPRLNLADVDDVERELVLYGLAYRGLVTEITSPTGTGKTLLATRLTLEWVRASGRPVHFDQEIGEGGSKATYRAHGATDDELGGIHYLAFPEVRRDEIADFVKTVVDEGEDLAVFDKRPDFMRSLRLAENSNDDVSDFFGSMIDPLRERVTTIILSPTGHVGEFNKGNRARGASEGGFKVDLSWVLSAVEPFDRQRVGRIRLECRKDRWGLVGVGRVVDFEIGGDGQGAILFRHLGASYLAPTPVDEVSIEAFLVLQAIQAGREIAPDEASAKPASALNTWMEEHNPGGRRGSKEQRFTAIARACELPSSEDHLVKVETGKRIGRHELFLHFYAAGEAA